MDQLLLQEDQHGLRSPWNVWPHSHCDLMRGGIPLSMLYSPTKLVQGLYRVAYPAVRCVKCQAVLNPYNPIDFNSKQYMCAFCGTQQPLPQSYASISEQRKPAELYPQYRTIEYELQQSAEQTDIILFLVDLCVSEDELENLKSALQLAIDLLNPQTKVALVTFGTTINVCELLFTFCPRKVIFRGTTDLTPQQIDLYLGLRSTNQKFVLPIDACRDTLSQIIEDLQIDPWSVGEKNRPYRATGLGISVASSLLHVMCQPLVQQHKSPSSRIMLLTSGPCTSGPGLMVDTDITQHMRHWPDIQQKTEPARYVKDCVKYYSKIAERCNEAMISFHVFASGVDQVGLFELNNLCTQTGGTMMISESFKYTAFIKSWRIFIEAMTSERSVLRIQSSVKLSLSVGASVKICGCIGPVYSLKSTALGTVSNIEIGVGGTDTWMVNHCDSDSTLAFFFDVMDNQQAATLVNKNIQIRTEYTDNLTGKRYLRVFSHLFASEYITKPQSFIQSFDHEAAACIMARMASLRLLQTHSNEEALKAIDRVVIKLSREFSSFVANDPNSVQFQPQFEFFPQFMYHFRRSNFLQLFGQSPDESIMKHCALNRQNVQNMLCMIQPVLIAYDVNNLEGFPVFLDAQECTPGRMLLLDTFFNLLIWTGSNIVAWRNAGYHLQPEYQNVAQLLKAPRPEADDILKNRFPSPRFDESDQGSSQARVLLARVNPSQTHKTQGGAGEIVATDDASLQQFLQVLKNAVSSVQQK